jgi:glycosyltransferase involved in cell wall biosynthesis
MAISTQIFMNINGSGRGGPQVWSQLFSRQVEQRGYSITLDLDAAWQAALFVIGVEGLEKALVHDRPVGYRVANGYLPGWFAVMDRLMQPEHHAINAAIARALEAATSVIYQSQWAKAELDALLYRRGERYSVIHNGVDLSHFQPSGPTFHELPILGSVGILRYRYRLQTLFEMSHNLGFPHRLLVVGSTDTECAEVLKKAQSDSDLKERLTYLPFVPHQQLPAIYQQMSLFVHPVCGDVCPNVVIEALACGVPVVAPRYGGTAELIGEAGEVFDCQPWVYDQAFVEAMTASAERAFQHIEQLKILARQRAEEHFDLTKMVDAYLNALELPASVDHAPISHPHSGISNSRKIISKWVARPRFYTAIAIRKAYNVQRRLLPYRPNIRPRIAFTLFDFHVGGIENWLYRLAYALRGEFDFYFLATRVPEFLPKFSRVGVCAYLNSPGKMSSFLQHQRIDLVQVHNERWPVDAALAAGVPRVIERLGGQRSWRRVPKYGLDLVIASSQMAAEAVANMVSPDKLRMVYNGIDLTEVDSAPIQRLFPQNTMIVGRATRFGRGQNLDLLLDALQRLQPRWPQLRLVLVGGDSLMPGAEPVESELHRRVEWLGLAENVRFTGSIEDPLPYVLGFDIGTCVSNDEGLPNSLIEAMACRKPVITSNVGAVSELVEQDINGLLFSAGDLDGFCFTLERLLADPALRIRLSEAGRRTIEERFTLAHSAALYAEIYHSLLDR